MTSPITRFPRKSLRVLTFGALISASAMALAAAPAPKFDVARVSNDIKTLSSDAFEGRGPATPGEKKTIDYIAAQMKAAGLQPAGEKGSWFQNVPLRMSSIVGTPTVAMTIGGTATPLSQGEQIAVRAAETGQARRASPSTPSTHIPTPALAPMISETSSWPFT